MLAVSYTSQTEFSFPSINIKTFGALALATLSIVVDSKPALFTTQTVLVSTAIFRDSLASSSLFGEAGRTRQNTR